MYRRHTTRRALLQATLGTAAGVGWSRVVQAESRPGSPLGANERIHLGIVGLGNRGAQLISWIQRLAPRENVTIAAVCDIWNQRRESAAAAVRGWSAHPVVACRTLSELCDLKDIDAVVIATPDFQHAAQAWQVVEAGKDVYCEKPFGCDFDQIRKARDAIRQSGRVFQAGTQMRGHGIPWAAQEFIRGGRLGKVSYVEVSQPLFQQRWRIPDAASMLREEDTLWDEFLCYLPPAPFNPRHYVEFRLFWPYSTGIFCQWMSHVVDLVNLVLDERPMRVTAGGGVYIWQDGRTNPDTAQCLVEYPSGVLFSYHMRLGNAAHERPLVFYGTAGCLDLEAGVAYGDGGGGEVVVQGLGTTRPAFVVDASRRLPDRRQGAIVLEAEPDVDHMSDFFSAIRRRGKPRADVEAAFNHALATTMAGLSLRTGRRIEYDPAGDCLRFHEEVMTSPSPRC